MIKRAQRESAKIKEGGKERKQHTLCLSFSLPSLAFLLSFFFLCRFAQVSFLPFHRRISLAISFAIDFQPMLTGSEIELEKKKATDLTNWKAGTSN